MRYAVTSFLTILVLVAVTTALPSLEGASDVVQQYESLMSRLYTTVVVAVLLVVALVVVTCDDKRHGLGPMRPASGGFMAGVNDDVHGGHMEGDVLVLSRVLGGQRFDTVPIHEDALSSVGAGRYRLVYQRIKALGTVDGDAVITVSDIDRDLAQEVLGLPEGTGALSVDTPDLEGARSLMAGVPGSEPTEYGFSTGVLSVELRNFRRVQGVPVPGPMALFGGLLPDEGEPTAARLSDFALGFHIGDPDVLVLSIDLGGAEVRMRELDERGFDGTAAGELPPGGHQGHHGAAEQGRPRNPDLEGSVVGGHRSQDLPGRVPQRAALPVHARPRRRGGHDGVGRRGRWDDGGPQPGEGPELRRRLPFQKV